MLLKENLKLTFMNLTLSTQGWNICYCWCKSLIYLFIHLLIYLFIYLFVSVNLRLVYTKLKIVLTNKYERNKQTNIRFEKPLPNLVSNTKQVQANQINSVPPLRPSEKLWFFDDSRRCRSQNIHSNAPNAISKSNDNPLQKIMKFEYLQV